MYNFIDQLGDLSQLSISRQSKSEVMQIESQEPGPCNRSNRSNRTEDWGQLALFCYFYWAAVVLWFLLSNCKSPFVLFLFGENIRGKIAFSDLSHQSVNQVLICVGNLIWGDSSLCITKCGYNNIVLSGDTQHHGNWQSGTWVTFTVNISERGSVAMMRRMEQRVSRREQRPTLFSQIAEMFWLDKTTPELWSLFIYVSHT